MGDGPDDRIRITPEVIANMRAALTKDHVDDYEELAHDSEACERCVGERLLIRHAADLLDAAGLAEASRFSPDEATAIRRVNAGLRFVDRGEALCLPEVKKAWEGLYEAALTVVPREDRS